MEDITIRPAMPDDAEGLIAHWIDLAGEPDIYVSYTSEEANINVDKEWDRIRKHAEVGSLCLVAEAEGKVIADFRRVVDDAFSITRHTAVLGMSVDRNYRNRGVGTDLMRQGVCWALGSRIVRLELEVYADNAPAIHLYQKFSFDIEGRKRMYAFQRGRYYDSLIMSRLFLN